MLTTSRNGISITSQNAFVIKLDNALIERFLVGAGEGQDPRRHDIHADQMIGMPVYFRAEK